MNNLILKSKSKTIINLNDEHQMSMSIMSTNYSDFRVPTLVYFYTKDQLLIKTIKEMWLV